MKQIDTIKKTGLTYAAPCSEVINLNVEGILCDSDASRGGIDPWRFNDNPMTF